jgi:hypothetical protein
VFITVDEGGGYYDSGYIQSLDFFGDGTRIPLIVGVTTRFVRNRTLSATDAMLGNDP